MKNRFFRIPMPLQILMMFSMLAVAGTYLLLGQQAPSEEADWPWKVLSESKVFLNGEPAGKLGSLAPLSGKIDKIRLAGVQKHLIDEYKLPRVLLVPSPMISIARLAQLSDAITEGTGETILVSRAALNKGTVEPKPNPMAMVVTTENVDAAKAKRLGNLKDADLDLAGNYVIFMSEDRRDMLRYGRTYYNTIEIGSDGKYYFNEQTAADPLTSVNISSRMVDPRANMMANAANFALPISPLKQRPLSKAELKAAIGKLINSEGSGGGSMIGIIASEKASCESLLQLIDALDNPQVIINVTVRSIEQR